MFGKKILSLESLVQPKIIEEGLMSYTGGGYQNVLASVFEELSYCLFLIFGKETYKSTL